MAVPTLIRRLPVAVLRTEVPGSIWSQLRRAPFGDLYQLSLAAQQGSDVGLRLSPDQQRQVVASIAGIVAERQGGLITRHIRALASSLSTRNLYPGASFGGYPVTAWCRFRGKPLIGLDLWQHLAMLALLNASESLADDIDHLLDDLDERKRAVLLGRYGSRRYTLRGLGSQLHLSGERVRQLETKTKERIQRTAAKFPYLYIQSAIAYGEALGPSLSLDRWLAELDRLGMLPAEQQGTDIAGARREDVFNLLTTIVRIGANLSGKTNPLAPGQFVTSAIESGKLTVDAFRALKLLPEGVARKILREVAYTGGIRLSRVQKRFGLDASAAAALMERLTLVKVCEDWYSYSADRPSTRNPVRNAANKILVACGEVDAASFCDGLRRYVSRHFPALAPIEVILRLLHLWGFRIDQDGVIGPTAAASVLAKSEKLFLELLRAKGPVVSIYEVAEHLMSGGLSLPAVTRVLQRSPIVERLDRGMYGLRGSRTDWTDLQRARDRQAPILQNSVVRYFTDGAIEFSVTLSRYGALTGVLACNQLPFLGGGWAVTAGGKPCGLASMDDSFLWGLLPGFQALGLGIGARVNMRFDTRAHTLTMAKVSDDDNR